MTRAAAVFGILAMVSWGIWTVLAKIATRTISPETAMIVSYTASVVVALGYLGFQSGTIPLAERGIAIALVAGVFGAVGAISFYVGLDYGRTAIVAPISALYFVVAAIIGIVFLGESVSTRDVVGIVFAVAAVALLAR